MDVYGCFMDAFWNFELFHTGPRVGTHTHTGPSGITHVYTYICINTIMIRASTCNNLISFHLYVYNDKFFHLHQHTLLIVLLLLLLLSFFLSFFPFQVLSFYGKNTNDKTVPNSGLQR